MGIQKGYLYFLALGILLGLSGCFEGDGSDSTKNPENLFKEAFPWFKDEGRTNDMTPVEIILDDGKGDALRFRIPKAYLMDVSNWKGGRQERIAIETGLPDLKPRPGNIWVTEEPGTPEYERKIEFFRNGLFIYLYDISYSKEYSNRELVETAGVLREAYSKRYEKQDTTVHGLEYYKDIGCSDVKRLPNGKITKTEEYCWERPNEFFITPPDTEGVWAVFQCTRLLVNKGGGCITKTDYKRRRLEYIFRRNQLHRWREFDMAVRILLDSFLVSTASVEAGS